MLPREMPLILALPPRAPPPEGSSTRRCREIMKFDQVSSITILFNGSGPGWCFPSSRHIPSPAITGPHLLLHLCTVPRICLAALVHRPRLERVTRSTSSKSPPDGGADHSRAIIGLTLPRPYSNYAGLTPTLASTGASKTCISNKRPWMWPLLTTGAEAPVSPPPTGS